MKEAKNFIILFDTCLSIIGKLLFYLSFILLLQNWQTYFRDAFEIMESVHRSSLERYVKGK